MGGERDTFRQLERANRRKTVELVVIFLLVYCVVGLALDRPAGEDPSFYTDMNVIGSQ
jgi:uncharacterized membrane protein